MNSHKIAPSLFQKAMTKICAPLYPNILIYIDDILLYSIDLESHIQLLHAFYSIAQTHGIILSKKKMILGTPEVDFLGITLSKGSYIPQPHIAQNLQEFTKEISTIIQLQQFLGLVNYISNFIPQVYKFKCLLSASLKKNTPPGPFKHTDVVCTLKQIS